MGVTLDTSRSIIGRGVERPNMTLYVGNLDESMKVQISRRWVSQFGTAVKVIAHENIRMRCQAFIVFDDQLVAEKALGSVQQFPFHRKQMEVHYAQSQSGDTVQRECTEERVRTT